MARSKPPKEAKLTIAIVGEGVTPKNVGLRQLAALLEATATTFEAVAAEKNVEPPRLSLTKVKNGSAAYELASEDRQAARVFKGFRSSVRKRGKDSSPRTRQSLTRLAFIASRAGTGLRVDPFESTDEKPIMLAAPLPEDEAQIEEGTVVYARVVGVSLDAHDRPAVTLRYDDGGRGEFDADSELLELAARLIGKHVAARVTFMRGESKDYDGSIENLDERAAPSEFMDAIAAARVELASRGIEIDADEWLAEVRDDD